MSQIHRIDINRETCIRCGACIRACVSGKLAFNAQGYTDFKDEESRSCIACLHCMSACPTGSLSFDGSKPAKKLDDVKPPSNLQVAKLLKMRRSCRQYKQENVSQDIIKDLMDTLSWSPTGCNDRRLHFFVVDKIEVIREIRTDLERLLPAAIERGDLSEGYVALLKPMKSGHDVVFRTAPHIIFAAVSDEAPCKIEDPVIALAQFEVHAQSYGLGTCWCGIAAHCISNVPEVLARLGVPGGYSIRASMLFGYPDFEHSRPTSPGPYPVTFVK